jgi:phospholipid/cholesterol/gamma-HCH transport system substrate-binding protein
MASPALKKILESKALAVGLLVAVAGSAFLVAYTFFRKGGYGERDSYGVHAFFDDITGLTWKSRVQIAGIQVGEVSKVTLVAGRARLDMRVKKDVPLRADSCLIKRYPSALLPDALLEATPGSARAPLLQDLPEEQRVITCVREAASVEKLLETLSKVATDIQGVTGEITKSVAGPEGSVREIVEHLTRISRAIDSAVAANADKLAAIIDNTAAFTGDIRSITAADRERYHAIAKNVEEASGRLAAVLASVQEILGPNQPAIKDSVQGVKQALDKLNHTLEQLDKVATGVAEGKGAAGKLLADERLGNQVATTVDQYTDYANRLYKLEIGVELRSEWLFNQGGGKTYFGVKLIPRPDKYYLLQINTDPRGVSQVTNQVVSTYNPVTGATDTTTVSQVVTQEQKLRFSAEFAKRFAIVTLRIGIIESTGGVGADLHLFDDHLQISANFFDFARIGTNLLPQAKLWANVNFLDHIYVTGGLNDLLNAPVTVTYPGGSKYSYGRDFFLGAGLYFTDQDLKTIIGGTGGASAVVR